MPYIDPARRQQVFLPETAGELNYLITDCINDLLNRDGVSYSVINNIIGAIECAKLEFYRRIAVPYEDLKIVENGDVYGIRPESITRYGEDGQPIPQQLQDDVDVIDRALETAAEIVGKAYTEPHAWSNNVAGEAYERPNDTAAERDQALAHHESTSQPTIPVIVPETLPGHGDWVAEREMRRENDRMKRIADAAARAKAANDGV